jgi:hypothetical protein
MGLMSIKRVFHGFSVSSILLSIVALLSLAGAGLAVYLSANGPWGVQDAATYVITARNMMRGLGFGYYLPDGPFVIWTIKPPLFSAVLAVLGLLGADIVDAARWFNVFAYAATIFLTGLLFIRFGNLPVLSIPACLLVITFPTSLRLAGSAMSEPLFMLLLAASFYCLLGYFRYGTSRWLVSSIVLTSLLPMTRYIGLVMIPVGTAAILLMLPGSRKKRLGQAVLFGLGSSLPILVWQAWIYLFVDQTLAGRTLSLDWGEMAGRFVRFYTDTTRLVLTWFPLGGAVWNLRFRYRYLLILLVLAVLFIATLLAARRTHGGIRRARLDSAFQVACLGVLWLGAYTAFLAVDGLIMTPLPPITNRILLPLFPGLLLGLLGILSTWQHAWFHGRWRWLGALPWLLTAMAVVHYYPTTVDEVLIRYHQGVGMTAYTWRHSETMAAVRALPQDAVIISNDSYVLWIWADRTAYSLVEDLDPSFIAQDSPYGTQRSDRAQAAFHDKGAALVIFEDEFALYMETTYGEAGLTRLETLFDGLVIGGSYGDGKIYYYPKP